MSFDGGCRHLDDLSHRAGVCCGAVLMLAALACTEAPTTPEAAFESSTPAEQGLNPASLDTLTERIQRGEYGAIHSLLILRHGRLITERYFNGTSVETIEPVYSVTKSVTALLFGVQPSGDGFDVHAAVSALLPGVAAQLAADPRKAALTLDHLLTMTAGFTWDELTIPYGDPQNITSEMARSDDWVRFVADRPMSFAPGGRFTYNSGCSVLLGAILANRVQAADELARLALFAPLGITRYRWDDGAHGIVNTGWGLHLRPRDMATIGQLVLSKGTWKGNQIVSADWIARATSGMVPLDSGWHYGYQWWGRTIALGASPGTQLTMAVAWGWGDQFIFVIPALDIVVATTAANFSGPVQDQAINFVPRYILSAVRVSGGM